jgi:dihydroorotase
MALLMKTWRYFMWLIGAKNTLYNGVTLEERKVNYTLAQAGMNPSFMCQPILKSERNVLALRRAVIRQYREGLRKFFLGTDTAPHDSVAKYREGCACGMYTAPIALPLYAIAFEEMGILDHLQAFASDIAAEFYNIQDKLSGKIIILSPDIQLVPKDYDGIVTPYAGQYVTWTARPA